MSVKRAIVREGLILFGFFATALSLFIFLEKKFPDSAGFHLKIALFVFIFLYAGRWLLRIAKGLMLIIFLAILAGIAWLLFKLSPLDLF